RENGDQLHDQLRPPAGRRRRQGVTERPQVADTGHRLQTDGGPENPLITLSDIEDHTRVGALSPHPQPPDEQRTAQDGRHPSDVDPSDEQTQSVKPRHPGGYDSSVITTGVTRQLAE